MLQKISTFLHQISRTWVMVLTLALMVVFMVFVLPGKAAASQSELGGAGSPDTTFFYQPGMLPEWAEKYGSSGRQAYIYDRWTFDLIFPIVYVGFLAAGISWLSQRLENASSWIMMTNLLPVTGGILDILENSSTSLFMGIYPDQIPGLAIIAAVFSALKWLFVFGAFLGYFILAAAVLFQKIRPKRI